MRTGLKEFAEVAASLLRVELVNHLNAQPEPPRIQNVGPGRCALVVASTRPSRRSSRAMARTSSLPVPPRRLATVAPMSSGASSVAADHNVTSDTHLRNGYAAISHFAMPHGAPIGSRR